MASLNDVATSIEAARVSVEAVAGPINSSKGQAEHTAAALGGLGIEGVSARLRETVDRIEEAESIRAALQGALVKAHFQVMSAIHGTMGPGAKGSGAIVPLKRIDEQTGAPKAGLDAVPPHLRQAATPTGDELTGVDPAIGPFQKEHENASVDRTRNRLSRLGRSTARNVEELQAFGRDLTTSTKNTTKGFDPEDPGTYPTSTEVPSHTPQLHAPPNSGPDPTDIVGTAIVMVAAITEGVGRLVERRRRNHGE
jgi:hypothetical protein